MFNFPDIPAVGQIFSPPNGPTWQWNGEAWESLIQLPSPPEPETMLMAMSSGYSTGIFYDGAYTLMNGTGTQVVGPDKLYFTPFRIRESQFFSKIGFNVSAPYTATQARLGIYDALIDTGTQYPAKLIYDAGVLDVTSSGIKEAEIYDPMAARGKLLAPGEYWLAIVLNGECTVYGNVAPQGMYKYGSTLGPGMPIDLLFSQPHVFGQLPLTAGVITREPGVFPNMSLRIEA